MAKLNIQQPLLQYIINHSNRLIKKLIIWYIYIIETEIASNIATIGKHILFICLFSVCQVLILDSG